MSRYILYALLLLVCSFESSGKPADSSSAATAAKVKAKPDSSAVARKDTAHAAPVVKAAADSVADSQLNAGLKARSGADTNHRADSTKVSTPVIKTDTVYKPVVSLNSPSIVKISPALKAPPARKPAPLLRALRWVKTHVLTFVAMLMLASAIMIVAMLLRAGSESRRLIKTARLAIMDTEVQKACRYVESHFAESGCCADDVCRKLTSGRSFLEALFQRELGMTVDDFILQVRINRAKILIAGDSAISLDAVAQRCGFATGAELAVFFKKIAGTGVDEFRKACFPDKK